MVTVRLCVPHHEIVDGRAPSYEGRLISVSRVPAVGERLHIVDANLFLLVESVVHYPQFAETDAPPPDPAAALVVKALA